MMVKAKDGKRLAWLDAFPVPVASDALDALVAGWEDLASVRTELFNRSTYEHHLTDRVVGHLLDVVSEVRKLPGHWGSQNTRSRFDPKTGKRLWTTRTDITYRWNDQMRKIDLVFEFKRLSHIKRSRDQYIGDDGMKRFVTGNYSLNEALGCMVGILLEDKKTCVSPLHTSLQQDSTAGELQMCKHDGKHLIVPSAVFPGKADFDTEHKRARDKSPVHRTICISHVFLEFGYPASQDG